MGKVTNSAGEHAYMKHARARVYINTLVAYTYY